MTGTPGLDQPVDPARPDPALAAEALRIRINAERCNRGLAPLDPSPAAATAALKQAQSMARQGFVGHTSAVAGQETFVRRLGAAGARFRSAAENVARTPLHDVQGQRYTVVDRERCQFARAGSGAPIPRQSYRMLADRLVGLWMGSAAHRANILKPRFRAVGSGIALGNGASGCGDVAASTVFLG